ncbi:DUF4411 family protein [Bacillus sp. FJAT-27251]|uniref:DUF4411 family protein n=1 Tax=Bacillus sp. FJAT-27251 TaxID=1684142 RepID=UPI0006A7C1A5|nr:DUF4411 family protein [Bacillus sp. FJAT-27251]
MFILDANVFINAHRLYYSFDFAPSFWQALEEAAKKSAICSIDKIHEELTCAAEPDHLHEWSGNQFREHFEKTDSQDVIEAYARLQQWANSSDHFLPEAKSEFASNADAWLIAYAKARGGTLVTHEAYNREKRNRILIPVACQEFEVPYVNTFDMLRQLNIKL